MIYCNKKKKNAQFQSEVAALGFHLASSFIRNNSSCPLMFFLTALSKDFLDKFFHAQELMITCKQTKSYLYTLATDFYRSFVYHQ